MRSFDLVPDQRAFANSRINFARAIGRPNDVLGRVVRCPYAAKPDICTALVGTGAVLDHLLRPLAAAEAGLTMSRSHSRSRLNYLAQDWMANRISPGTGHLEYRNRSPSGAAWDAVRLGLRIKSKPDSV